MTTDFHHRAKSLFNELIDVPTAEQERRLQEIAQQDAELAKEVSSLLHYHTVQSLVAPPATPKLRTRSTLSTHYANRSLDWLKVPARALLVALPLFGLAVLLSYWTASRIQRQIASMADKNLQDAIQLRMQELDGWEQAEIERASAWVNHPEIRSAVIELVQKTGNLAPTELREYLENSSAHKTIHRILQDQAGRRVKFAVWDRRMYTLADWNQDSTPEILGSYVTSNGANTLARILKGRAAMYLPYLSSSISLGYQSEGTSPVLSIFVPVADDSGAVIATIMVRDYGLEEVYNSMFQDWNVEPDREYYLVSREGAMVTPSRFDVKSLELAFDNPKKKRTLLIRDPGVDLLAGEQPKSTASTWPETFLARQVKSKSNGSHVAGYRNYVGRNVIGAWQWVPRHGVAMALEVDYASTFAAVSAVRWAMLGIAALFAFSLIASSVVTGFLQSANRRLRDISEVGPYQMQEIIGEGGMGRVYLAEHALLCRQSAVKVLIKGEKDLSIISRFEREVQLASQLTHPNTIAIYDFGRNKDGIFYYAMEYINGAHLGQLIEHAGALPPGRCIYVLRQLCRALHEAHQAGVVHRDIKPQNIMVCNRGGEPDFVKLFDYGLVKAFAPGVSHSTSQTEVVVGTPRFMAPERLTSPWLADPRVDVYSIGALAYFLLTGQLPPLVTPCEGMESEQPGVETLDLPADVVDFGGLLSVCMAVEPSARPSSMNSLLHELDDLSQKFPWGREDSGEWWYENEAKLLQYVATKRKKLNKT